LRKFIEDTFGADLAKGTHLNLERALTILDIHTAQTGDARFRVAQDALLVVLRETFFSLHDSYSEPALEYDDLAEQLDDGDTVITFNWDLLLDEALGRSSKLAADGIHDAEGHYGRFLSKLTGWGEATIKGSSPAAPQGAASLGQGTYLKVHGSIDWFHCVNESCRVFGRAYPLLEREARHPCAHCFETLRPLIVPPTLNKPLRALPAVRRLWSRASYELKVASSVLVWGYSLPPTDFYADWLLHQTSSVNLTTLTIINPQVTRGETRLTLNQEYLAPFVEVLRHTENAQLRLFRDYGEYTSGESVYDRFPETRSAIDKLAAR
jgi:hypothetical protein